MYPGNYNRWANLSTTTTANPLSPPPSSSVYNNSTRINNRKQSKNGGSGGSSANSVTGRQEGGFQDQNVNRWGFNGSEINGNGNNVGGGGGGGSGANRNKENRQRNNRKQISAGGAYLNPDEASGGGGSGGEWNAMEKDPTNFTEPKYYLGKLIQGTYCSRVFSDCEKRACRMQSPNFPGVYPRNLTCFYAVRQVSEMVERSICGPEMRLIIRILTLVRWPNGLAQHTAGKTCVNFCATAERKFNMDWYATEAAKCSKRCLRRFIECRWRYIVLVGQSW